MSRRDFQLIADVLRAEAEGWPPDHPHQSLFAGIRLAFAEVLKSTNPRFDEGRFLTAAQPGEGVYMARIEALRGRRGAIDPPVSEMTEEQYRDFLVNYD
jgi:hypothetical protein